MLRKNHIYRRALSVLALVTSVLGATLPAAQADTSYDVFDSTVKIYNCSASVIAMPESTPEDHALILTNGHCIQPLIGNRLLDGEEVISNRRISNVSEYYQRALFYKGNDSVHSAAKGTMTDIVYATMKQTDVAILRVDKTYQELSDNGVKTRPLATTRPLEGAPITIPSTYWHKSFSCSVEKFIPELHEGNWRWSDSIRYSDSGCDVQGGSSGSPIVDATTGAVIGINNTRNDGGQNCSQNNPCEIDELGQTSSIAERGYGQQTYYIPLCFEGSNLNLNKPSCSLPQ